MPSPGASDARALTDRFRAAVAALGVDPSPGRPLALAVSGGPDSMAMLALAAETYAGAVIAATVDHRLRAGSADEAAMVARWCGAQGIAHATLAPDKPITGASPQARARQARYGLLARWATDAHAAALATAHHRDDQAETFLMRAARGSGPGGLAGIRPRVAFEQHRWHEGYPRDGVVGVADVTPLAVIRPLLDWSRAALRAIVIAQAAPFVDDPGNADERYDRTRARGILARHRWLDAVQLAAAADHAREADEALRSLENQLWHARRVTPTGVDDPDDQRWIDMADLPRELRRRLSRAAIEGVRSTTGIARPAFDPAAANIEPLLDALAAGRAATHAGVLVTPLGQTWRFTEAPPRRSP